VKKAKEKRKKKTEKKRELLKMKKKAESLGTWFYNSACYSVVTASLIPHAHTHASIN
jgi:hypothetical protein